MHLNLREHIGLLLVIGAAIAWYIATRAMVDAMTPAEDDPAPVRRAFAHWLPVAVTAVWAIVRGQPQLAIGLVFATSVASLSLVSGMVLVMSSDSERAPVPTRWRRIWPFVLPAAMLTWLAGFSGQLTWLHALVLVIEGAVVLMVWTDPPREASNGPLAVTSPALSLPTERSERSERRPVLLILQFVLAFSLIALGAWAATRAAVHVSHEVRMLTPGLIAATMLSPALVLPMLGTGTDLARRGLSGAAMTTHVAFALLNLCLLLPLIVILFHITTAWPSLTFGSVAEITKAFRDATQTFPFPIAVWRVDSVIIAVLGFLLLPAALGRWALGRAEGIGLTVGYCLYLILTTTAAYRS